MNESDDDEEEADNTTINYLKDLKDMFLKRIRDPRFIVEVLTFAGLIFYACETRRANDLTADSLRLQHGARVRANYGTWWYDVVDHRTPHVIVQVQNEGEIPAENVYLRAQLSFLKSPPKATRENFSRGEAQPVTSKDGQGPTSVLFSLTPTPGHDNAGYVAIYATNPADYSFYKSGAESLYVWGMITYSDAMSNSPPPAYFCRSISAGDIATIDSPDGFRNGSHWCDYPK